VNSTRPRPFIVGVNMPWWHAGHDFGFHPYGWGDERVCWEQVDSALEAVATLGVTVVRWFLLGSGVSYPCRASAAPRLPNEQGLCAQAIDDYAVRVSVPRKVPARMRPGAPFEWQLQHSLPSLPPEFIQDFLTLCRLCQKHSLRLFPSLLSYEWFCLPIHKGKGVYGGGRRALVFGSRGSDVQANVGAFLDVTLQPLLAEVTRVFGHPLSPHTEQHPIFAWESINEPDWVTQGGPTNLQHAYHPIAADPMNTYLAAFRERVLRAGYQHSIGFKEGAPRWLAPQLRQQLMSDGERYWHQVHHYPTVGWGQLFARTLSTNRQLPPKPRDYQQCLVGEFPTALGASAKLINWHWGDPTLAVSERKEAHYLQRRWQLIADRRYDGAFAWAVKSTDERTSWNASTQEQTRAFVSGIS
jgi:hypothetical protein